MEMSFRPHERVDASLLLGLVGPYDGTMVGVKGRIWFTPQAAAQVFAAAGNYSQSSVSAGLTLRFKDPGR
jgi:hypothetical protein